MKSVKEGDRAVLDGVVGRVAEIVNKEQAVLQPDDGRGAVVCLIADLEPAKAGEREEAKAG